MRICQVIARAAAAGLLVLSGAMAAPVPVSQSFESFSHGDSIVDDADWSGEADAGLVSTNVAAITALAAYTNAGGVFPLPSATHEKVLALSDVVTNTVASATGGVVVVDWLLLPSQRDEAPAGSDDNQMAFYVSTNSELVVWHRNTSAAPTNEWLTLSGNPAIGTSDWVRVTIHQDYATDRYQIAINGTAYTHALGKTRAGATPGSWFHMVQTNGYLSDFSTLGGKLTYVDDLVFTNRAVSYSATTFAEASANNGTIATTNTITLAGDTFANTTYSAGTHFSTSGVPAGLSVALTYVSPTQVEVSLTGTADPHTGAAGTSAMGMTLEDAVFTLGSAADVTGYARSDLAVTFGNPPALTYAGQPFVEGGANNGIIGNTVTITLAGDTFAAVSPLVAGTHYTASGIPANLTLVLTTNSAAELTATLSGQASAHEVGNSTSFTLTFLNDTFQNVATNHILGTTANLGITFASAPVLTYSTDVYSEAPANDGTVLGGTITLSADFFNGAEGDDFVDLNKVLITPALPGNLAVSMTLNATSNQLTVAFSGAATSHLDTHDVTDLSFVFQNGAFVNSAASAVEGYNRADHQIDFDDQPVVIYSGAAFSEASNNNGTIANVLTATLTGDTLAGGARTLAEPTDYSVTSGAVPDGLTLHIDSDGSTGLTISLDDSASPHTSDANGSFEVTFSNALFNTVAAANITGANKTFNVSFANPPVINYSRTVFSELSGGQIDNTTPIEITISGDTFTGANGSDFVAAGNKVTIANVPAGLTLVLTKNSDTKLLATLTGTATAHANINDVGTLTITFLDDAITAADANQVTGYSRTNLEVDFNDSTLKINLVPYRESFEDYADGYQMTTAEGWQASGGAAVTSETAIVNALTGSFSAFPLVTNRTQVLRMTGETSGEIRSGAGGTVYADTMFYVTPREVAPAGSTDYQFAMFVDTNQKLNVWHRDTSGTPATNTWATLGSVTVTTGAWHRVTVQKDYAAGRYALYLDGAKAAIQNPTRGDTWFNMVGTVNAYMSRVRVLGATAGVPTYLDDLVVDTQSPGFIFEISGSVFRFR